MIPRARVIGPALVLALLAAPALPAQAATVEVSESVAEEGTLVDLVYSASPGEANRLTLSQATPAAPSRG